MMLSDLHPLPGDYHGEGGFGETRGRRVGSIADLVPQFLDVVQHKPSRREPAPARCVAARSQE